MSILEISPVLLDKANFEDIQFILKQK